MPENRKLSEIQLVNEVFDIQGKSLENQNRATGAISDKYDWVGTIEEYQEQRISTEHPEWVCYIINDVKGGEGALDLVDYVKKVDYEEDQEDVVHKADDEVITGAKTFTDNDSQVAITTKSKTVDNTQIPATTIQITNTIENVDKNDVTLSKIYTMKKTDGSNGICLQAINGNNKCNLGIDSNGSTVAPHPAASSDTSNTNIATVGWINDPAKSTNIVHRNSDEEISGRKAFTAGGHAISIRRSTSTSWTDIRTEDANGSRTGGFRNIEDSGANQTNMYVTSSDGNTILGAISINTDGTNAWTKAPASDVVNSIVTTTGISKERNGYVKLGNGIIIQWGNHNRGSSNTVTLPTAFTSTNYSVTFSGEGYQRYGWSTSKTTTTFSFNSADDASQNNDGITQWIAVGY